MPKMHAMSRTVYFPLGKENNTYSVRLGFVMAEQLQTLKWKSGAVGGDSFIIHKYFRTGRWLDISFQAIDWSHSGRVYMTWLYQQTVIIIPALKLSKCTQSSWPALSSCQASLYFQILSTHSNDLFDGYTGFRLIQDRPEMLTFVLAELAPPCCVCTIKPQRVALIALFTSACLHPPACGTRQPSRDESLRHVLPCMTTFTSLQACVLSRNTASVTCKNPVMQWNVVFTSSDLRFSSMSSCTHYYFF